MNKFFEYLKIQWIAIIALIISLVPIYKDNTKTVDASLLMTGVELYKETNGYLVYPVTFTITNKGDLDIALMSAIPFATPTANGFEKRPLLQNGITEDFKGDTIQPGMLKSYVLPVWLSHELLEEGRSVEKISGIAELPFEIEILLLGADNKFYKAFIKNVKISFQDGKPVRFFHEIKSVDFSNIGLDKYQIDIRD